MKWKILIIDRSKWRTGGRECFRENQTGLGATQLLNDRGFMCCLGFECLRLGKTKGEIKNIIIPQNLNWGLNNHLVIDEYSTIFTNDAIKINDDYLMSSQEREEAIKKHFATANIEVEFINEYIEKDI